MFFFNKKSNNTIRVNELENYIGKVNLIDIREPYEYSAGHVQTAKNIPMNTLLTIPEKYLDKNKEYYIICQSGGRSTSACNYLSKLGYNVINVVGGTGSYRGNLV